MDSRSPKEREMNPVEQNTYCAFISYRHKRPDMAIAKRLHTLIENYTIPQGLRKEKNQKRLGKVFRDQEELPLSADLGKDIETALDSSEWLICICTPAYLESRWCMREIEYFIEKHGRERVLAVLATGEPQDSFPAVLCRATDADGNEIALEPLAADVRADSEAQSLKKLQREKLRILAPMLGSTFDGLYQRQRRRRMRQILAVSCAAALALGAFGAYSYVKNQRIENERIAAARNEFDFLLEKASVAVENHRQKQAVDLLLQAHALSDSLDGYRADQILPLLSSVCYAGDFAIETALKSAPDSSAVSAKFTTEYFSPDGAKVLCPASAYSLDCCDAVTGDILWSSSFREKLTSARWKADGSQVVATAHSSHLVRIIDGQTGETVKELNGISWVSNAAFVENDVYICFEKGFLVWHPEKDPDGQNLDWYMDEIYTQACTGRVFGGGRFIAMHDDRWYNAFGVIDTQQEAMYLYKSPYNTVVNSYAVSPDGKKLFVHQYRTVFVCDLETDEILWQTERETGGFYPDYIADSAGPSPVWAGDYIFDSDRLTDDYMAYTGTVYDARTGEVVYTLEKEYCMDATVDGAYFLCAGGIYRASDGQFIASCGKRTIEQRNALSARYATTGGPLYAMDASEEHCLVNGYIKSALGKGSQYAVAEYKGTLYADRNDEHRIISPDGQYTVVESVSGPGFTVMRMDGTNWQYLVRDFTPKWWITFSPDSRLVALGSEYGAVAVYEMATKEQKLLASDWFMQSTLKGLSFNRDGKWLMYANLGKTWFGVASMDSGEVVYELHATKDVKDWGFDEETGDAVVLYEDGSALCADIFTSPEELYTYAGSLYGSRSEEP